MAYVTISHWSATEITDEMIEAATSQFAPMIMSAGASAVQMVRTGEFSLCVVTQYDDAATAEAAQAKIAEIRGQAANEFPMKMDSTHGVKVVGSA